MLSADETLIAHTRRHGLLESVGRIQDHRNYYSGGLELPFLQVQTEFGWNAGNTGTAGESPAYHLDENAITVKQDRTQEAVYRQVIGVTAVIGVVERAKFGRTEDGWRTGGPVSGDSCEEQDEHCKEYMP